MAERITTILVDNLAQVAATKIASMLGVTKEMKNLSSEFDAIKEVFQHAETRQISDEDMRGWVQKLKGVAYDVEDLVEEWRICFGDHQVRNSSSSNLISHINRLFQNHKYRERFDEIKSRLEQIATEKERYGFSDDTCVRRMRKKRRTDSSVDQTSVRRMREERDRESWVDETSLIGRDEDKNTLVTKLITEEGSVTCGNGSDKAPTIFISGMGGLGKTTLAKSVFNDERVKKNFGDKRMWVCVGEVFNREVIMKSMIERLGESVKPLWREQLREMIKDRKYLLILDDVWKVHYLQWEPLQEILNQGAKGSRIVITTRNTGVVAEIRSAYTLELKGLNEDECLLIFRKVVVEQGMEKEYEPLMDIGRKIVKKCGGLPLAVKTVASAVRGRRRAKEQWEMIRNSKIWDLPQPDEGILPALMLSYRELTPQLKNCFGYCSIFKKDTLLEKDELVRLWVSQGYIVVNDRRREEEVGEECFEELLARSMFHEPKKDDNGTITRCKMHDLVHDFAQWVTKEECRIIVSNDDENNNNNALSQLAGARHCVIRRGLIGDIKLTGVENVRTLSYTSWHGELIDTVLQSLKSVRVLKIRYCSVGSASWEHLGKLVHLRHLNIEVCSSLVNLPKTIVSLRHLQVINLQGCSGLEELPEGILKIASLRRLKVEGCLGLKKLPNGIGRQKDVVVILDRFPVVAANRDAGGGSSSSGGGGCHSNIGELGGMNIRAESLHIFNLEEVGSTGEVDAVLKEKTSLRTLLLEWNDTRSGARNVTHVAADDVLEGLRPPPQLSVLGIQYYPGQTFPRWMGDGGAAFRPHQILNCENCNQLPPLGQLPSLNDLRIGGLDGVVKVGREFLGDPSTAFPCLKSLKFECMRNWSEWEALSPIMPALESLEFIDCPKLKAMPSIIATSIRRLTVDSSSPMLHHSSFLQHFRLFDTIAIAGNAKSMEGADDPLICVVIGEKATELPARLLPHPIALRKLILADLLLLRSLPEELTQLTALEQLIIQKCPNLSWRCRLGRDLYPKIADIPLILIDEENIKSDGQDIRSA